MTIAHPSWSSLPQPSSNTTVSYEMQMKLNVCYAIERLFDLQIASRFRAIYSVTQQDSDVYAGWFIGTHNICNASRWRWTVYMWVWKIKPSQQVISSIRHIGEWVSAKLHHRTISDLLWKWYKHNQRPSCSWRFADRMIHFCAHQAYATIWLGIVIRNRHLSWWLWHGLLPICGAQFDLRCLNTDVN